MKDYSKSAPTLPYLLFLLLCSTLLGLGLSAIEKAHSSIPLSSSAISRGSPWTCLQLGLSPAWTCLQLGSFRFLPSAVSRSLLTVLNQLSSRPHQLLPASALNHTSSQPHQLLTAPASPISAIPSLTIGFLACYTQTSPINTQIPTRSHFSSLLPQCNHICHQHQLEKKPSHSFLT